MSGFRRPGPSPRPDSISDLIDSSLTLSTSKPDSSSTDHDDVILSPVSPLRGQPTTSSSSSSSGSGSGPSRPGPIPSPSPLGSSASTTKPKSHSGEIIPGSSTTTKPPSHSRSNSSGSLKFIRPITGPNGPTIGPTTSTTATTADSGSVISSPPPPPPSSSATTNVLPAGNIIPSGRIPRTGLTRDPPRRDVLGSGKGNYGHGSIMRSPGGGCGGGGRGGGGGGEAEEWNRSGCEAYEKGNYGEALKMFEKAVGLGMGTARVNRAKCLERVGRVYEAVEECSVAVRLDSGCGRGRHLMGVLMLRLGQVQAARKHLGYPGVNPSESELHTLEAIETHLSRCADARKHGDSKKALEEAEAAIAAGAHHCPQLSACRAECLLKLMQLEEADNILAIMGKDTPTPYCSSDVKFFGMLSEAYPLYVRAQIDLAHGRFGDAAIAAQKAAGIDPRNAELTALVNIVKAVTRARNRGNDLVKANRLTEARAAYDEGLAFDHSNAVLHCNKAACSYLLKKWEQCVDDCSHALHSRPNYAKALQRRAFSYLKLEKWVKAIQDYEVLKRNWPDNKEYVEGLSQARAALKKSREGVEEILDLEQFRTVTSSQGVFVVHFFGTSTDPQCKLVSAIMDVLDSRYPVVTFLKVDVKKSSEILHAEKVKTVPMVKIYKDGSTVKEVLDPSLETLDALVRYYIK